MQAGLTGAKQSLTIASLYSGVGGNREKEFSQSLQDAVQGSELLQTTILLDALRGTRPSKDADGKFFD